MAHEEFSTEVIEVTGGDLDTFFGVAGIVYNDGKPYPEDQRATDHRRFFVASVDGVPAGVFNICELQTARGLATVRNGGIAFVAVLPEFRAQGVGSAMMRHGVQVMHKEGYETASLYAFAERYYRRFGYQVCGGKLRISVPLALMPRLRTSFGVRPVHCFDEIEPCYLTYARQRSGLTVRDAFWWERKIGSGMVYGFGDPVEAYIIVHYKTGFHDTLEIAEFVSLSQAGYESMLAFMSDLGANRGTILWHEDLDSPFYNSYLPRASQVTISTGGPAMFRAVHLERALQALRPLSEGEFTFEVQDPVVPENNGPWCVQYSPHGVEVSPAKEADLSMSIQTFTQAFFGQPSLGSLVAQGLVEVRDATRAEAAMRLLTPMQVALYDFF